MKQILLLFMVLIGFVAARAQSTIRHTFEWKDQPLRMTVGGITFDRWELANADYGSIAPGLPIFKTTVPVAGPGQAEIEIVEAAFEPFAKQPGPDDALLAGQLQFEVSIFRTINDYAAKVAVVPIIKTDQGYQRLIRLVARVRQQPAVTLRSGPTATEISVLNDGSLYKIAVDQNGVHKLSYSFLKEELGISDLDNIDPRTIKLFGNGGGQLPYPVDIDRPDDLIENHIQIIGEADGSFDPSDYLLFYGEGASKWSYDSDDDRFSRRMNVFDARNYYFIKISNGEGLRVPERPSSAATPEVVVTAFDEVQRLEEEERNIMHEISNVIGSGEDWYGDFFRIAREYDYPDFFNFQNLIPTEPATLEAVMALRTGRVQSRYTVDVNGTSVQSELGSSINFGQPLTTRAVDIVNLRDQIFLDSERPSVTVSYPRPAGSDDSEAYLDYVQLRARRQLRFTGNQMAFQDAGSRDRTTVQYRLENFASGLLWNIDDPLRPVAQMGDRAGAAYTFTTVKEAPPQLERFIAFNPDASLLTATAIGPIENQNVHGIQRADMVIVYHPDFVASAEQLAEHRRSFSNLIVETVNIDHIYNEFSSGSVDVTAIRDFAKVLHERDPQFRYLLLIGDASFDSRDIYGLGTNFLPTFEFGNSELLSEVGAYPSDDYIGIFQPDGLGRLLRPDVSIAVGRLPVKTAAEAAGVVGKIIRYDNNPVALGDWRTRLVFIGDDEDNGLHSRDANRVAERAESLFSDLNQDRLYFDIFPQQSTPAGDRYPEVEEAIDRSVFRGAFAFTYLGHGGPRGWAQERVLSIAQVRKWNNQNELPLFITATCTFAGYDDAAFVSAGEEILLNPNGGAIALLSTTRPVFASSNFRLTRTTIDFMLERTADGQWPTLGDVMRQAKNASSSSNDIDNARKYALLGDPAQRLALPSQIVRTETINGLPIDSLRADTLRALEKVTITGSVTGLDGQVLSDFNGTVIPSIYDKEVTVKTLQQDPGSPLDTFRLRRSVLFRGRATVTNGRFEFSFVLPQDINYAFGPGKISYYAFDPVQQVDATGSYDGAIIGGTNEEGLADDQGPEVEVFMNTEDWVFGSNTDPNPTLLVKLRDDNGINVAGSSIGHDLEAFLDEDTQNALILNDFYEASEDNFREGQVRFPLFDIEPGRHTLRVRAWDVANNSGEGLTEFVVAEDGRVALERVLNYPNPFTDRTCFQFDHNLTGQDLDVLIQIYTISGRLVKTLESVLPASDGALRLDDCIEWDGRDDFGDQLARGVYLYRVRVRASLDTEQVAESDFEKLVILK